MPLSSGTRLGPYEIVATLGAGGMGEVYRARDARLERDVAIKILPAELRSQPERIRRFEQEAKATSALNHPSIITIFDVGETDGTSWVAMELVDGVTLEERIGQGPLAVSKALEIAASIADGLAAAHQAGVVHRDLKPSNVMVARDGFVKILDFGLAKLVAGSGDGGASHLETETSPGLLIGTVAYMSPEQAAGRAADERADQFALGLVLYEMLTGRPAFREETAAETLTAILRSEPAPIAGLRPDTPAPLQWIVERCLSKDAEDRYAATADLARDLKHLVGRLSDVSRSVTQAPPASAGRHPSTVPWLLAALLAVTTLLAVWRPWSARHETASTITKRFSISLPPGHTVASDYRPAVAISPDGTAVVHSGRDPDGGRSLYVRAMGELELHPLPGTDGGSGPFFSPDGSWVGFFAFGKLKKVPLAGGTPITLADAPNSRGATWMPDDSIVFAPTFSSGLHRVSASGGAVETLSTPNPLAGEYSHRWPQWLPDGRTLVFVIWTRAPQLIEAPSIGLFDLATGSIRSLISDGEYATYGPSGHLLYTRQGRIHAVGFDLEALETVGQPRSITDVALVDHNTHAAHFAISQEGTLAYLPGSLTSERTLVWVAEGGVETPLDAPPRAYVGVRLSPDGRKIATTIEADQADLWVYDIATRALSRVTFEDANGYPIWTPDGQFLTFSSSQGGGMNIFKVRADGTGEPQQLTDGDSVAVPGAWSPGGRYLAYNAYRPSDLGADLWILPHEDGEDAYRYAGSGADERWAQFSPDGRWLAYVTNRAGLDQVYIGSFPKAGPLTQISIDGGRDPLWSPDGDRLFYRNADEVWEVGFDGSGNAPRIGRPRLVFEARYRRPPGPLPNYHLGPDGRFLMIKGGGAPGELDHLNVVLDWLSEITTP